MKHFCTKKGLRVWGPGYESGAEIVPFPCQKGGCTQAWVCKCNSWSKSQHLLSSQTGFGSNHTHLSKKKGGRKFGLSTLGLFFVGKNCAFLKKPWKHVFLQLPTECQELFRILCRGALPRFTVWNAGVGRWSKACISCTPLNPSSDTISDQRVIHTRKMCDLTS